MGAMRDWRTAFEHLERERSSPSLNLPGNQAFMLNGEVAMPDLPGSLELAPPAGDAASQAPLPAKKSRAAPKKAKTSRGKKPPAKKQTGRKAEVQKKEAPAPKRKVASPPKTRETPAATKPRKSRARKQIERELPPQVAALALPVLPEPLAEPMAETLSLVAPEPLARSASPTQWRKQGLADAIGYWLRHTTRRAGAKLTFARFRSSRKQLDMLQAENAELRRELDALKALTEAAQFRFQD